jgi:hypothetical protein
VNESSDCSDRLAEAEQINNALLILDWEPLAGVVTPRVADMAIFRLAHVRLNSYARLCESAKPRCDGELSLRPIRYRKKD